MIRLLFRVAIYLCAAYGAWIVLGEIGLVTATPPSVEEILRELLLGAIEGVF